MGNVLKSL